MSAIVLEQVTKRFGDHLAVDHIDLTIPDGSFTVFVGPSGCGKTTLLRLVAGLEDADHGRLLLDGEDVSRMRPAQREVAMVFQSYALYPHMSVRANIGFALKLAGMPSRDIERRVDAVAELLGLEALLDRKPAALSGGQRQRVAIGRAVVREPRAFLFDEPLSNLDAALRGRMRLEIKGLQRQLGTTAIYVTHDQAEAMTMADQIVVFRDGRIEQVGAPLDIYHRPANLFVAQFIGSPPMNVVKGDGAVGLGAPIIGVRPEHLAPTPDGRWQAAVVSVEQLGSDAYVYGELPDGTLLCARQSGTASLVPGQTVRLEPDPAHVHRFDSAGLALV
ncbi:ABC transporter ATP-binding protein [Sphingomonas crusticola]|uniref:ABC transporter ATP-binding protein n=1 Tax=Sphingomonas crusticola TaxID=1697973 RepID=UPI000E25FA26|nr:ABC transporter ATP-binding protein [Sphingomonas crusticola]